MTANENAQIIRIHCNYKTRASVHSLVEIHLVFEQMGRCSQSVFFLVRGDIPPFIQEVSSVWSLQRDNPNRNQIPGSLHQSSVFFSSWLDYSVSKALKSVSIWSYLMWLHVFEFSSQLHRKPLNTAPALWICPCFIYSSNRRHYWEIIYAWNTKLRYRFVLTSYFGTVLCYNRSDIIYTICDAVMKQFNTDKCPHSQAVCRHNDLRVIFLIWFFW